MALPVSFNSNLSVGSQNSYHGPFKSSAGNFYTVLRRTEGGDGTHWVSLHKADAGDPTDAFSEVDSEAIGTAGQVLESIWCFQVGDIVHIVVQENDGAGTRDIDYLSADLSADTLSTNVEIESNGVTDDGPNASACSIGVATNGDIVVVYQGDPDMDMGTEYARIDSNRSTNGGANWDGPVSIDELGGDHWTGPVIVAGDSDRMHIFFKNFDNNDLFQRRLASNDGLETFPSSFNAVAGTAGTYNFGHGISYDDGGTQKVRCPYGTNSGSLRAGVAEFDSAVTPSVTDNQAVADNTPRAVNSSYIVAMAVDGLDNYLMYVDVSDADIYRDLNDGSDSLVISGTGNINHVSPNIYDRSGTKLAYIYDDAGVIKYNEVDIGTSFNTLSGVKFSDQNYFHGPFDI